MKLSQVTCSLTKLEMLDVSRLRWMLRTPLQLCVQCFSYAENNIFLWGKKAAKPQTFPYRPVLSLPTETPTQKSFSSSSGLITVGEQPLSETETGILCSQNRKITSLWIFLCLWTDIFLCLICSYFMSFSHYFSSVKRLLQIKESGFCPLGNRNEEHGQKRRPEKESALSEN